MAELKRRFFMIKEENPDAGDVILMWYACSGKKYTRMMIAQVFRQVVDKDQYEPEDKKELINYLYSASMSLNHPYKTLKKKDGETVVL